MLKSETESTCGCVCVHWTNKGILGFFTTMETCVGSGGWGVGLDNRIAMFTFFACGDTK